MKKPDWDFWRYIPHVKTWQACALSLDIDPDALHLDHAWTGNVGSKTPLPLSSFPSGEIAERFNKRFRIYLANGNGIRIHRLILGNPVRTEISLADFVKWATSEMQWEGLPPEFVAIGREQITPTNDATLDQNDDAENDFASLFDPVGTGQLEKMFHAGGDWVKWAGKAKANGLISARAGRAIFNPYKAARWWLEKQNPAGWDWARCMRTLANNLPERSRESKHLLTGELESTNFRQQQRRDHSGFAFFSPEFRHFLAENPPRLVDR